jgi:hypothetical protein
MQIWLEIISSFPEREGKYLICPIHSTTKSNYPMYKILEELRIGDAVFHCLLEKATGRPNAFTSYSKVKERFDIVGTQDPLCTSPPPYRKVDLFDNTALKIPITMEILSPYKSELLSIARESGFTRSPFDKNFRIKQLYLSRIPIGFIKIFSHLSRTHLDL